MGAKKEVVKKAMARGSNAFGVEAIQNFDNERRLGGWDTTQLPDLPYTYNISNAIVATLSNAGYIKNFYFAQDDVHELDLRSAEVGGNSWSETVIFFYISTHGGHYNNVINLGTNVQMQELIGHSNVIPPNYWPGGEMPGNYWKLGVINLMWLAIYSCNTIDLTNFSQNGYAQNENIFYGLHLLLGSHDLMSIGPSTAAVGQNFANNLLSGQTVAAAWLNGVNSTGVDQHPAVLSAEQASTWNNGAPDWPNTTMDLDHYLGRGAQAPDIGHPYWIGLRWID